MPQELELRNHFFEYNRDVRVANSKAGCMLVVVLMPAGLGLDYFVYPDQVFSFFMLRILCSALAMLLWGLLSLPIGKRHFRVLGMTWFLLPSLFISIMIHLSQGVESSYYAGLNLVLIAVSWVAQVEFVETIIASVLTLVMYLWACQGHGPISPSSLFNNLYFIILTGIIVATGSYYLNKLRFREFALRAQLDENRSQLEDSNKKLVELDRAKSDFFANVSHELRTPLTLLIGPLERMRGNPSVNPATQENVEIMYANAMRLLRLINDLLTLVRLDTGVNALRKDHIAIKPFLQGITQSVRPMAEQSELTLQFICEAEEKDLVWLDREKFEKIAYNLLFNSIKFTPAKGTVTFSATVQNQVLTIAVEDTGVGIAPGDLKRIFDRFWQAETSTTRRYQGVGIGLSLVKELAVAHGGSVEATSEVGRGTRITVKFDVTVPEGGRAKEPNEQGSLWLEDLNRKAELYPAHVLSKKDAPAKADDVTIVPHVPTILIVDDEPDMRRFLASQLRDKYQVCEASSGEEGLAQARSLKASLILLDFMMPEMDGMEVLRQIRANPETQDTPIVILTARVDEDFKIKALRAGATDFLTKPFSSTELMVRSSNITSTFELRRQLLRKTEDLEMALTQLKDAESQMVHQAKMASLGQLSAGLMHEINNPLNFTNTAFHILKKRIGKSTLATDESFKKPLDDIQDGIRRVVAITTSLRDFTHPDDSTFQRLDLGDVLSSAIRFTQLEGSNIKLTVDLPKPFPIRGNDTQLIHLFINLIQNSIDSLNEVSKPGKQLMIQGCIRDSKAQVLVRDNGNGIPQENISKIYDAFFTTKKVGSGTGLGLNICYRIMSHHGGQIQVESVEQEYCQFNLVFPT